MTISENQLDTWSHQGSIRQSAATYETIKNTLQHPSAPFANRSFNIFLQGSYGNNTNIYADSDVDIIICLTSVYYNKLLNLSVEDRVLYDREVNPAEYSLRRFKREVTEWLQYKFGNSVRVGKKAIVVPGNGTRRDVDVLACAEHRTYHSYRTNNRNDYWKGIVFWTSEGEEIINYPKQHSEFCTDKHQNTHSRFKPNVRVLKNTRNAMVDSGYVNDGTAPSYFLEGMLSNVPYENFSNSYQHTFMSCLSWLGQCDSTKLLCANQRHYLIREGHSVCWNTLDYRSFLSAVGRYWSEH